MGIIFVLLPYFRRCLPHLKSSMRGIGWEDSHWAQLFSLLGFKAGSVTKENVTLAHFLDRADAVIAHAQQIKELDDMVSMCSGGREGRVVRGRLV